MSILVINIKKWEDYNPGKETKAKTWSWFRFEYSFFTNPDFADVPPAEKWIWPFILGECAKKKRGDNIKLNVRILSSLLQLTSDQVHWMIAWLVSEDMIEVISDNSSESLQLPAVDQIAPKSIPNRAQIDSKSLPNLDQKPPYERTNENEDNNTIPIAPFASQRGSGRKDRDAFAEVTLSAAIGAVRDQLLELDAKERVGEDGWKLLLFEFRSWKAFYEAFHSEHRSGFEGRFKTLALRSLKSHLRLADKGTMKPGIQTMGAAP